MIFDEMKCNFHVKISRDIVYEHGLKKGKLILLIESICE